MAAIAEFRAEAPPLRMDDTGTIRVGRTRVTLDVMLSFYHQGCTPEQIVEHLDVLDLGDVYSVIAYYLHNKSEVDAYIERREREADELRARMEAERPTAGLKELLIKRMAAKSK